MDAHFAYPLDFYDCHRPTGGERKKVRKREDEESGVADRKWQKATSVCILVVLVREAESFCTLRAGRSALGTSKVSVLVPGATSHQTLKENLDQESMKHNESNKV